MIKCEDLKNNVLRFEKIMAGSDGHLELKIQNKIEGLKKELSQIQNFINSRDNLYWKEINEKAKKLDFLNCKIKLLKNIIK
jgi:hypothetical protein